MSNNDIKSKFDQAMNLCNNQKFAEAEVLLHEILKEVPKQSEAWRALAQIDWYGHHDIDKAEDELIEALKLDPKNLWGSCAYGESAVKGKA